MLLFTILKIVNKEKINIYYICRNSAHAIQEGLDLKLWSSVKGG